MGGRAYVVVATAALVSTLASVAWAQEAEAPDPSEPRPPQSLEQMIAALRSPEASERVRAIQALGERGTPEVVPHLTTIVRSDPVSEVRGWAVRSLYAIGTPEARSVVVTAAREDPDERVRAMAARLSGVAPAEPRARDMAPQLAPQPYQPMAQPTYTPSIEPRRRASPGLRLRRAGWIIAGISYGLAVTTSLALLSSNDEPGGWDDWGDPIDYTNWGWKMLLPVVGPALAATTNRDDIEMGTNVIFWIWSLAQATGVVLLAVGYARRARHRAVTEEDDDGSDTARSFGLVLAPGGPGGPAGLTMGGTW